jgi:hypothetical protein
MIMRRSTMISCDIVSNVWLDTDGIPWAELAMVRARIEMMDYLSMQVD